MRKEILERLLYNKRSLDERDKTITAELLNLQKKMQELQSEQSQLKGRKIRADELAKQRDTKTPDLCPDCYVEGHKNPLAPIPNDSDDPHDDLFRCRNCGFELLVKHSF